MNDSEIIRKAVELADGWGITMWSGRPMVHCPIDDVDGFHIDHLPNLFLDSLAAQLVRQVDALTNPDVGLQLCRGVSVVDIYLPDSPLRQAAVDGPDRTMNTLRAIVESGVLDV